MNETDIRKYAELMKELGLTGLEIKDDNKVVRLERTHPTTVKEVSVYPENEQKQAKHPDTQPKDSITVKSPIVGVFYAAPAENTDPYVKVGDSVQKGQTLCIIEAMKLMNEITAEEDGVITEICVTNGQVVEYGTELFRIKK